MAEEKWESGRASEREKERTRESERKKERERVIDGFPFNRPLILTEYLVQSNSI